MHLCQSDLLESILWKNLLQGNTTGKGRKLSKGKTPRKVPQRVILAQSLRVALVLMQVTPQSLLISFSHWLRAVLRKQNFQTLPQQVHWQNRFWHGETGLATSLRSQMLRLNTHQESESRKETQAYRESTGIICYSNFRIRKVKNHFVWICIMELLRG